ncbi:hypothetical protein SKAU_G00017790 [Synaphobranchus kaupii]|uniref:Uncharacterized protein n=1 Tax=Synaphobranchus kaupii TaxID=118154 RepID=A0A9Q1GB76_SYNKA|nr:hypothetical protein SKAU_G00017790 [Synaphobranchus kaupii]
MSQDRTDRRPVNPRPDGDGCRGQDSVAAVTSAAGLQRKPRIPDWHLFGFKGFPLTANDSEARSVTDALMSKAVFFAAAGEPRAGRAFLKRIGSAQISVSHLAFPLLRFPAGTRPRLHLLPHLAAQRTSRITRKT